MFVKGIRGATAPIETLGSPPVLSLCVVAMTRYVGIVGVVAGATLLASSAFVSPAHGAGFSISDPSNLCAWSWNQQTSTLTCTPAQQQPVVAGAPSGCTLTASPTSLPAGGGNVTLTAACSGGNAPTQYAWSGGAISGTNSSNVQQTNI